MRNILLFFIFTLYVLSANAETAHFSEWMQAKEFEKYLASKPDNLYPAIIEGKALLGDGIAFRVILIQYPSNNFRYETVYGASDSEFEEMRDSMKNRGYVLIQHQEVTVMGGLFHQATWVNSENDL